MNAPAPGLYLDIEFDQYVSWNAMNISTLLEGRRSMLHLKQEIDLPSRKRTAAMWLGVLGHTLVLEPVKAMAKYVVMPPFELDPLNVTGKGGTPKSPTSTAWYRKKRKEFETTNMLREVVTQQKYDEILGMVNALALNPRAKECLASGEREISMVWVDASTGVVCKGRIDLLDTPNVRFLDLKIVENAARFERTIEQFAYHVRMSWYQDGLLALGKGVLEPWLMASESTPPFGIRVAPIGEDSLRIGRSISRELLDNYARCISSDYWPGYDDPDEWNLPGVGADQHYGLKITTEVT